MTRWALALSLLASLQEPPRPQDLWPRCGSQIDWITDGIVLVDGESIGARQPRPAADRDELLEQAKERAKAAKRLILWYVPRTTGRQMNRASVLDGYLRAVAFTDPDVVELVKRKFVPLKMTADAATGGPLGIKPFDFVEPGFVFLTPDGEVVHKIDRLRTFSSDWFVRVLIRVLEKHAAFNAPSGDTPEELMWGGDHAKALERAKGLLAGRILRRMGQGAKALEALAKAEPTGEAAVERARVHLGMRDLDAARRELDAALAAGGARTPEAHYWLALVDWLSAREEDARKRWQLLVREHPDSPWTWRAAGNLATAKDSLPDGPIVHEFEETAWAPEGPLPTRTLLSRAEKDLDDAARRAVEWLLRHQRSNGSWADSRYVYCPNPKILPNVFVAVAALGALALLEWRDVDPKRCDGARARAEAFALDDANMNRGHNEEVYADAYRLWYLSRRIELVKDGRDAALARMAEIARRLAERQSKGGFWAHEYPNPFCTAAVLFGLQRAKAAGADVDAEMIAKGCAGLKKLRAEDGRQPYGAGGRGASPAKDSSARSAMCDLVLLGSKDATADALAASVAMYWKYADRSEAVRVCDFHADGELGGFFFWHGFTHTVEAAAALEAGARAEFFAKAKAHLLRVPEWDGSFIDSHELGKSYGTAMALIALRRVK
jgi:tetratricopeptide (TPR) repeat protein